MEPITDLSFLRVKNPISNPEAEFKKMAKILFDEFVATYKNGNGKGYRLVDIEFYLLSLWHQDFFTYGRDEQQDFGKWLKHPSGMDLAFGNKADGVYGGILIRGIREIDGNKNFINGSLNVRDALSQMDHTVTSEILNETVGLRRVAKTTDDRLILVSGRVGLTIKSLYEHHRRLVKSRPDFGAVIPSKHESFINKRYRFITDICPDNKFREKERVALISVNEGICSGEKINEKYGWKVIK